MSGRLIVAIVTTVLEESLILLLGVWLLPMTGVKIPFPLIPAVMLLWLGWSVFTYRQGTRALVRKPVDGLADMTGTKGVVVRPLHPEGVVRIKGELWNARSQAGWIDVGMEVVVAAQEGLKVIVRPGESGGRAPSVEPRKDYQPKSDDRQDGSQNLQRPENVPEEPR